MSRSGRLILQLTGYKAFIPSPLPPNPPIHLNTDLQALLAAADRAIEKLDAVGDLVPNQGHVLAMYVRKEALLSSQIEGTQATLENLFEYESQMPLKNAQDVEEVVCYIKALNHGMKRLAEFPMSIRLIKEMHEILLSGVRGQDKTPGEFRRSQNWIGPAHCTLATARFVPPPPQEALSAMGDLELYLHAENSISPLINIALIHYQFETIHPFLDGNGRLGRLLITLYLFWKKKLRHPLLYLSYYLKLHRQEYYDRLNWVREKGDFEQWVSFFLEGVIWTSESAFETIRKIVRLKETHTQRLIEKKRSTALAIALLDYLFEKPHLSIADVAARFSVSYPRAQALVEQFQSLGFVKEITGQKRNKRYVYWEYLDCLSEGV